MVGEQILEYYGAGLKGDQPNAFVELNDFVQSENFYYKLSGAAGTGKTFLMGFFVDYLINRMPNIRICQCAPTNKAVKQARRAQFCEYANIKYRTIHSLMGIREKKIDGKQVFKPEAEPKINDFDLVIVDEYSMIGKELGEMIFYEADTKVIFVGDHNQLPPVNEDYPYVDIVDIPSFRMEQPLRQAMENPIIELSQHIIKRVYMPVQSWDNRMNNGIGVEQYSINKGSETIKDLFIDYFTSYDYSNDTDYAKVLAFTNKSVSRYNSEIRRMYFDEDYLPKIVEGERLVVLNTIKHQSNKQPGLEPPTLFYTNDEIEVESFDINTHIICGVEITYYEAIVKDSDTYNGNNAINIIHEKSEQRYKDLLKGLADTARSEKQKHIRANLWKLFFEVKESFADVAYSYALTIHKAQGSSYKNVFFDMSYMGHMNTNDFKKRLQYTAVTRASEKLFIMY